MIPNKSNFKLQELTPITGVKPYVIRYWETEFSEIAPITSDSGHKIYARKDVEAILKVKKLLFEDKLSIPEAKVRMQISNNDNEVSLIKDIYQSPNSQSAILNSLKIKVEESLNLIREIKAKRNW